MNDLERRIRTLVEVADPDGTVTVRWLASQVGVSLDLEEPQEPKSGDLTVEEVADHFGRATSTVRGWLSRGELDGYKLNRRDWRVTRAAVERYEANQRNGIEPDDEDVDISEWRNAS